MNFLWVRLGRLCYFLAWPGLWLYMGLGIERTRVLISCGNEVLVVRDWLGDGRWALPGGGLHRQEQPIAGARREAGEETGLKLTAEQLKLVGKYRFGVRGLHFNYYLFAAELQDKPAVRVQFPELTAAEWVKPAELSAANAGPDVLQALALLAGQP